jgi:hypothetical protein
MKKIIATIAFMLSTLPVFAVEHIDPDLRYVLVVITAIKLNASCPSYAVDPGAVTRDSEEEGANIKSVDRAIDAVYSMYAHRPYDHDALRPDVTRTVLALNKSIDAEYAKNPDNFCKIWGEQFIELHMAAKK